MKLSFADSGLAAIKYKSHFLRHRERRAIRAFDGSNARKVPQSIILRFNLYRFGASERSSGAVPHMQNSNKRCIQSIFTNNKQNPVLSRTFKAPVKKLMNT